MFFATNKKRKFWFSFLALAFVVIGWFFDKSEYLIVFNKIVCPDCVRAFYILDGFKTKGADIVLSPEYVGFDNFVAAWPGLRHNTKLAFMGRSYSYQDFDYNNSEMHYDFDLIAYGDICALKNRSLKPMSTEDIGKLDDCNSEVGERWSEYKARKLFTEKLNFRLFLSGALLFFVGIGIDILLLFLDWRAIFRRKKRDNSFPLNL